MADNGYFPIAPSLFTTDNQGAFPGQGYLALRVLQFNDRCRVCLGELNEEDVKPDNTIRKFVQCVPVLGDKESLASQYQTMPDRMTASEIAELEARSLGDQAKNFYVIVGCKVHKTPESPSRIKQS